MTREFDLILKVLEQSSTSEGIAIAECLRGIDEGGSEEDVQAEDSTTFLLSCAEELRGWAQFVIDEGSKLPHAKEV